MPGRTLPSHTRGVLAQLLLVEVRAPRRVRARDLYLLRLQHPMENATASRAGPGKGGLGMRIVRCPQEIFDPNVGAQRDAQGLFLTA